MVVVAAESPVCLLRDVQHCVRSKFSVPLLAWCDLFDDMREAMKCGVEPFAFLPKLLENISINGSRPVSVSDQSLAVLVPVAPRLGEIDKE